MRVQAKTELLNQEWAFTVGYEVTGRLGLTTYKDFSGTYSTVGGSNPISLLIERASDGTKLTGTNVVMEMADIVGSCKSFAIPNLQGGLDSLKLAEK